MARRASLSWERDEIVANWVGNLSCCDEPIQERMLWHLFMCEDEFGHRVAEGLELWVDDVKDLGPLPTQTLSEAELERMRNLGRNGPRNVEGLVMAHCVPNERDVRAGEEVSAG